MVNLVKNFTNTTNFTNALKVTIAAVLPVVLFAYYGYFEIGMTIAIGAFLTYPSDIPSTLKHKINGVLVASFMVAGANLVINVTYLFPYIFYPFLVVLLFFLSMISVYGQRATMVSFSALLAVSLAFAHLNSGVQMLQHAALMLAGGLFYLLVALVFHFLFPYRYLDLQIAECIKLTSKYLKLRGDLWDVDANRPQIIEKQLHLQVEINLIHENLREIIFRNHSASGSSNQNRKMLIVFITLVEILELALSTSFNHSELHQKFDGNPKVLKTYQNLAYNLATTLKRLSKSVENKTKYFSNMELLENLEQLENSILDYEKDLGKNSVSEGVLMLNNMQHYVQKQIEKIRIVERAFTLAFNAQDIKGKERDLEKFLTPLYYPLSTLRENLSFSSSIFRHSLRLTVTIVAGVVLGKWLPFQNVYWILLTIVVIMRPGYGLTKKRSYERILGTLFGGAIAFGLISIVHQPIAISALAILSMLLGFSFTQINYKIGATFVTMYVVFVYGMLTPNIQDVIQYRILDTLVGAALSFTANYLLWPTWEFLNVRLFLEESIQANRDYLKEISLLYNKKGDAATSYKLARKNAFVKIGNLMASFQRMLQEPKSKQKQSKMIYKLVELNHSLLSSTASLGTYIQTHQTTKASAAFNVVIETVVQNLEMAMASVKSRDFQVDAADATKVDLDIHFTKLKNIRRQELKMHPLLSEAEFESKMQESQLVIEQLIWLVSISKSMIQSAQALNNT
ncbi:MAG: FUSC family protein [Burkholderiales bacterium]|nr:FUSC family protein [Flavobacterium sp.]